MELICVMGVIWGICMKEVIWGICMKGGYMGDLYEGGYGGFPQGLWGFPPRVMGVSPKGYGGFPQRKPISQFRIIYQGISQDQSSHEIFYKRIRFFQRSWIY
jgi:hypothetical protein